MFRNTIGGREHARQGAWPRAGAAMGSAIALLFALLVVRRVSAPPSLESQAAMRFQIPSTRVATVYLGLGLGPGLGYYSSDGGGCHGI